MSALAGLRVLDLSRLLPGPFCTQLLGDLGADVIKIEEPGQGDPARHALQPTRSTHAGQPHQPGQAGPSDQPGHAGRPGLGALFSLINRNKRSLTLNLRTSEGRDLLLRLVETADVLVESFRPGVLARLGLGYDPVLGQRNPRLIYASLSGFGQAGPYRDRAGHDLNYLALAGVLGYNVDRHGTPVPPAVQIADLGAGTFGALAILAAVIARQQTGRGQALDVSLFGSALAWLPTLFAGLLSQGRAPAPGEPTLAGGLAQYGVYRTADDRYVTLGALEPKFLLSFLEAVGRPELARLAAGDAHDRDRLRRELAAILGARSRDEWVAALAEVDTCFAPVQTLDEALHDPQTAALGMLASVAHPVYGQLPQLGLPFALQGTPGGIRRPPPALGEHTAEILAELGIAADELAALQARGVI